MDEAIVATNLTKRYGELVAVDHVSFEVEKGEFFGFLGPNGAGKTTTIRMLTGIIRPDEGTASIMGYDVRREIVEARQLMGIVPEMANVYVDLSVWQNLMFMGELYEIPKDKRRKNAERLLRELNLYDRRDTKARRLSKGMRQRLLLCMALINDPEILFLDEPTVGLDIQSARLIREMLRDLNENGVTVFLTTHNMEEASQLCDRIAIINHGRIAAIDTPEKLRGIMRELQCVEVSFSSLVNMEDLLSLRYVREAKRVGKIFRLYTDSPFNLVEEIVDFKRQKNCEITWLQILAPKLEDVFLKITGRGG